MNTKSHFNISRRRFIAASATALGFPTIIPATAIGKGGRPAPSERITVASIGFGTIAIKWTPNFLREPRCQVVAIADVMKEAGHYGYEGELTGGRDAAKRMVDAHCKTDSCKVFADFRAMLDKEDIDAVQIATPDHWHAYQTIYCARRGKHVYTQKPLGLTVGEERLMIDEVTKAGVTFQTGSQKRSAPEHRLAVEIVRSGALGKVRRMRVGLPGGHRDWSGLAAQKDVQPVPGDFDYEMWLGPAPHMDYRPALLPLNWRHNWAFSGGMITDHGAHHFDIAQWAMNKDATGPVEFSGFRAGMPPETALYNTAPTFHFECRYADGLTMVCDDEAAKPLKEVEEAFHKQPGKADKAFLHDGIIFEGEDGRWLYVQRGILLSNPAELTAGKFTPPKGKNYEDTEHTKNFIDCIFSGQPTNAPIEAAHRTNSIAHLANIALRLGREKLRWNPETERVLDDDKANAMLTRESRKPWAI